MQIITLRKPSRVWTALVLGVVVMVLWGCFSPVWWERFVLAAGRAPIRRVETSNRVVALTFEVDWGSTVAPQILDILDQGQVQATFFVTGPWAGVHPEILARLHRERHEVGNRGYIIENLGVHSQAEIRQELVKAQELICATIGYVPAFFRPPLGNWNDKVVQTAAELGYQTVLWDIDALDWKRPGRQKIISRVLQNIQPGSIIRLQASDSCTQTAEALSLLLAGLQEKNLNPVTLSCLLSTASQ